MADDMTGIHSVLESTPAIIGYMDVTAGEKNGHLFSGDPRTDIVANTVLGLIGK